MRSVLSLPRHPHLNSTNFLYPLFEKMPGANIRFFRLFHLTPTIYRLMLASQKLSQSLIVVLPQLQHSEYWMINTWTRSIIGSHRISSQKMVLRTVKRTYSSLSVILETNQTRKQRLLKRFFSLCFLHIKKIIQWRSPSFKNQNCAARKNCHWKKEWKLCNSSPNYGSVRWRAKKSPVKGTKRYKKHKD